MEFHEIANIFPLLIGIDFESLRDDIAKNGLLEPIVIYEGKILDGRNRYTACLGAGVLPDTVEYNGDDPLGFVIAKNLHRRHLNESQRALVASKLANMQRGTRTDLEHSINLDEVSLKDSADMLNVSRATVATENWVLTNLYTSSIL